MGRFYTGDISGKFWFGVQASDDADHFGVEGEVICRWYGCGCEVECFHNDSYCEDCYNSLEEHIEDAKESFEENSDCSESDEDTEDEDEDEEENLSSATTNLYYETEQLIYNFNSSYIEKVKTIVSELDDKYGHLIKSYEIEDELLKGDAIEYEVVLIDELENDNDEVGVVELETDMEKLSFLSNETTNCNKNEVLKCVARLCLGKQILYCLEKHGSCSFVADL